MKNSIFLFIFLAVSMALTAQTKKVAILETVDKEGNVPYAVRLMLRTNLTYAISNTPGFEGFDRVDMASIMGEQNFQRTGMVSDDQIRRLGEMTGCSSILVAEAALYDNSHIIVTAKILNVETASVENSAPPQIASTNPEQMQNACAQLATKLIGGSGGNNTSMLFGNRSPKKTESKYGADSVACVTNLSIYRVYYRQWTADKSLSMNLFNEMVAAWREVLHNCPRASQFTYIDGVKIMEYYIIANPIETDAYVDTISMLMDARAKYFPTNPKTGQSQVEDIMRHKAAIIEKYKRY